LIAQFHDFLVNKKKIKIFKKFWKKFKLKKNNKSQPKYKVQSKKPQASIHNSNNAERELHILEQAFSKKIFFLDFFSPKN